MQSKWSDCLPNYKDTLKLQDMRKGGGGGCWPRARERQVCVWPSAGPPLKKTVARGPSRTAALRVRRTAGTASLQDLSQGFQPIQKGGDTVKITRPYPLSLT